MPQTQLRTHVHSIYATRGRDERVACASFSSRCSAISQTRLVRPG
ncbi:unnamed protein product [Ectocarpus sp. 8 AP-2014]